MYIFVLLFKEIDLRPEISSQSRFRIQRVAQVSWTKDERTENSMSNIFFNTVGSVK